MKKFMGIYILVAILLLACVLTLVVPSGVYDYDANGLALPGSYHEVESDINIINQLVNAPINGFVGVQQADEIGYNLSGKISGALLVVILVVSIGMFQTVVNSFNIFESYVFRYQIFFKNNIKMTTVILILFFTFCATTHGMYETTIAMSLSVIALYKALNIKSIFPIKVIIYSCSIGYIGGTLNPWATGIASTLASTTITDGMALRFIILLSLLSYTIYHLLSIIKNYKTNENEEVIISQPVNYSEKLVNINFMLSLFPFLIMTYSFTPFSLPLQLDMVQLVSMFIVFGFIIGIINNDDVDKIVTKLINGVVVMMPIALALCLSRGVYVIMFNAKINDTLVMYLVNLIGDHNIVVVILITIIFYIVLGLFIPSTTAQAYLTMPIIGTTFGLLNIPTSLLVTIYQACIGILMICSLSSVTILSILSIGGSNYKMWINECYKYTLVVTGITFSLIFISILI